MPGQNVTRIERNAEINIKNFFTLWRDTEKDDASQARLLLQLLKPEFREQIKLSDNELPDEKVFEGNSEILHELLNRILLHILIIPPAEWSMTFKKTAGCALNLLGRVLILT